MTPSLMLAVLVIVLAAATSVHSAVAVATDDATAAKILDLKKLDDLTKRLRGNDKRLIRVSPSATTIERQKELCTGRMISSLVKTIDQDGKSSNLQSTMDSMQPRFKAAEVLTNCCFEHSENRALAGTVTDDGNVFKGLQNLIRTSMEVFHASMKGKEEPSEKDQMLHYAIGMIIAQASELIWILSYNNEDNQRGFYEAAIVTELIES